MKALLLHIATDSTKPTDYYGTLGVVGPIFGDGSFEYIPITDFEEGEENTYGKIPSRNIRGKYLSDFLPKDLPSKLQKDFNAPPDWTKLEVHNDPDFSNKTYGEPYNRIKEGVPKTKLLATLEKNGYLFFVASLAPHNEEACTNLSTLKQWQTGKKAKYIIGYFKVQGIYRVDPNAERVYAGNNFEVEVKLDDKTFDRIKANPHYYSKDDILVVVGDESESKLLQKAFQITIDSSQGLKPNSNGGRIFSRAFIRGFKQVNNEETIQWLIERVRYL